MSRLDRALDWVSTHDVPWWAWVLLAAYWALMGWVNSQIPTWVGVR